MKKKLGEIIKENRLRKCWSQEQLAQRINATKSTISRIELDGTIPKGSTLLALIQVLNITVKELLDVYF